MFLLRSITKNINCTETVDKEIQKLIQISQKVNTDFYWKTLKDLLLDCIRILFLSNFSFLVLYIPVLKQAFYLFCNCKRLIFLFLENRNIFSSTVSTAESVLNKQPRKSSQIKKMREVLCLETPKRGTFCEIHSEVKIHQKHICGG